MSMTQAPRLSAPTDHALPLWLLRPGEVAAWNTDNPKLAAWPAATGFSGKPGEVCLLPGSDGTPCGALAGLGAPDSDARRRFTVAAAAKSLPKGTIWAIETPMDHDAAHEAALGWLLSGYSFARYKGKPAEGQPALVAPNGVDADRVAAMAEAEYLTRDLINTPASDMGPDELEGAATDLAAQHGAEISVIRGDDLLAENFPLIHAVGRAADRAPRLIEMVWGTSGPALTLVGKGVCFDTGGLNLKPGPSMGLMKKDMGGAATVLGLAHMIMTTGMAVRLRVLIPAVENAVAGNSFRPGDILTARNGLTVEVNNTDAEGRLVLADALALGAEATPDLMVSMATLTGAARVAVGPDLAPYYTDDETLARAISEAGARQADPVWRMPFWSPYDDLIEPGIADLDNAPSGGMAGSITAALFLRRFAGAARYLHFDIYGWNPSAAPARPKGGAGQGARAVFDALPGVLGL